MSDTMVQFVRDLRAMQQSYLAHQEPVVEQGPHADGPAAQEQAALRATLQTAQTVLDHCEALAHKRPVSLPHHHQTLGIVQEAEADFNTLGKTQDAARVIPRFLKLVERFQSILE